MNKKEKDQIINAAARVWTYIGQDAYEMGVRSIDGAIEMVIDRLYQDDNLDKKIHAKYNALSYGKMKSILKSNDQWY